ncbi:MAG: RNA polymerase sigma factor [Lachnospiraceae bacterium]|nr:RNA polymerase sigma factor [Lachnospiraceae bacterium]
MKTDLQLIKKAKSKDPTAFAALYEKIYKDLYHFALYTLKNPTDAEDLVSETILEAYAQIHKLRREESFKAWIFTILSNKCKQRFKNQNLSLEEIPWDFPEPCSKNLEMDTIIREEFFSLSDEERLIISMHIFAGYKSREIAKILHMNENTIRSKESRALKKMAANLKPEKE